MIWLAAFRIESPFIKSSSTIRMSASGFVLRVSEIASSTLFVHQDKSRGEMKGR